MPDALDIAGSLRGRRIFVTGATGFVGKVLVERLLWSSPDVGRLMLLVRPSGGRSAAERVDGEILGSPLMARLRARHGGSWRDWAAGKVEAIAGDLGRDRFGLSAAAWEELCRRVDRAVAGAATVTFDERLDRALELNARGARRVLELARDAGGAPLVHVSTCYVSGRRAGRIAEEPVRLERGPDGGDGRPDPESILAALDAACREAREGAEDDAATRLVAAGIEQAERYGFHDVYTLTKALGELLVTRERGAVPVAIVRPAIVESALAQPIPGWLEAVRVADPLLVAYGRGRTRTLPGAADVPLELVPVDYVVHALLAALAELGRGDAGAEPPIYQVASTRNPITLGELLEHAREGFAATPLRDEAGEPIVVGPARLVAPDRLRRRLASRSRRVRWWAGLLGRLGRRRRAARLAVVERTLEHFIRLVDVYRPYLERAGSESGYRDDATLGLWERLAPAQRAELPFDVAGIEWRDYVARVHVPGLVRFALRAESGAPPPAGPQRPLAERQAAAETRAARAGRIDELFADVAAAHPDTVAFQTCREGRWLRYTYGQALATTTNVAWRLATEHGIGRGDRVVLWAVGCPEWVLAAFAVHRLGAAIVPLDPQWPAAEVAAAARLVGARLICCAAAGPARAAAEAGELAAAGCPAVPLAASLVPEPDAGLLPEAARWQEEAPTAAGGSDDLAAILFTSGTTVSPKAVPLTHGNYLANVRDLVPLMRLSRERLLSVLPIHHAFEQMVGLLVPLAGASTISYVAELRPAEISWMMATTRPTVLVAVPRLLELLHAGIFRSVEAGGPVLRGLFKLLFAISSLSGGRLGPRLFGKVHRRFGGSLRRIATGGSALEPALGESFRLMGFQVAEGYGMTETSPVLTVNPWSAIRFGSVGRPLPGVEIELRPPDDAAGLEPGSGEIWVRGANVMSGYYENPEATAEVLEDGWLNTGDIGRFDADGYLYISGRTKDVIVTDAGKNVYPEEVELRYRDLPGVEELVVLGLPSDGGGRGERVSAVVVPRAGAAEGEVERIRAAIAERSAEVPTYQQISRIEIWGGELPKTTTLKVKRGLLRRALLAGERGAEATAESPKPPAPEPERTPPSEDESWVLATVAQLTRTRPERLGREDRLADLGVDSLTRVELVGAVEARFGLRLDDAEVAALERVGDLLDRVRSA